MMLLPVIQDPINIKITTNEEFPKISLCNIVTEALLYAYYMLYIDNVAKKDYLIQDTNTYQRIHMDYKNNTFTLSYNLKRVISNTKYKEKIITLPFSKDLIEDLVSLFRIDVNTYRDTLKQFKLQLKINHKKFLLGWKTRFLSSLAEDIDTNFTKIQDNISFLEANNIGIKS
ncbi:MAG: hypothetical protein IKO49_01600 [Bacilli bacterium]|nr:hypothetical protein [Clostridia bacterium]MBR4617995.1 hypothetical protein [Bacilli bacterium]